MSGNLKPGPDSEFYDPHSADSMLTRIFTKLDSIENQIKELKETQKTEQLDNKAAHEKAQARLDSFERDRWYQRGIVATIAVVVGFLVSFLQDFLHKK